MTDSVALAVPSLCQAFATDPAVAFMMNNFSAEQRTAYMPKLMTALLSACTLNKGTIYSLTLPSASGDAYSASCTIVPPGEDMANPWTWYSSGILGVLWDLGLNGVKNIPIGYGLVCDAAKARHLDFSGAVKEKYYYVFIIGAGDEARGQGCGSRLMSEVRERCKRENMPCWLESTTEGSRRLYERLGWETKEEIVLGAGKVGADGMVKEGGEGVKIWGMLYRPEKEVVEVAAA